MRFYDYKCTKGHVFERYEKTSAPTVTTCDVENCEAEAKRMIGQVRIGKINQIKAKWLEKTNA
jgi:predicted nucleic acid-binding Zn ribbon protein